jgi:hypothetical protein
MPSLSVKSIVNLITAGTKSVDRAIQSTRRGTNKIRPKSKATDSQIKIKPSKVSIPLPDECWNLICDNLSAFDQIKLRRVNKQLHNVVEKRLEKQIYLDIVKCDVDEVLLDEEQSDFQKHRRNNVLLHISERNTALIVDDRWTSRDVYCTFGAIQFFSKYAKSITMDVQIAELIIVGLSTLKLSRWHAFECYVNAVGPIVGDELHMKLSKSPPSKPELFTAAKEITIRALISDLSHLSRIPDYSVSVNALFNLQNIEMFRINIIDNSSQCRSELGSSVRLIRRPHKHMRIFKKWLNSTELREKYVQQYS